MNIVSLHHCPGDALGDEKAVLELDQGQESLLPGGFVFSTLGGSSFSLC